MNDNPVYSNSSQSNIYGPLTVGQIFERTAALLRQYPKLFFGIGLVIFGIELIAGGILGGSELWINGVTAGAAPLMKAVFVAPLALLGGVLIFIFAQIIKGAIFFATRAKLTNMSMTVGEACKLAAEKAGRLVAIAILVALRILGFVLLFYFAFAVLFAIVAVTSGIFAQGMMQNPSFQFGHGRMVGMVILGLVFLVCAVLYVVFLFWLVLRYSVAIPAAIEENLFASESIRRSIQLTRHEKGRLLGVYLAVFGVYIVFFAIVFPMQLMMAHAARVHLGTLPPMAHLYSALVSVLGNLVGSAVMVLVGVATTLCYFDLRVRKEGFGTGTVAPASPEPSIPLPPMLDGPIEDIPVS